MITEEKKQELQDKKRLSEMKLFKVAVFGEEEKTVTVTRVPGGWIINQVFVPEGDEPIFSENDLEILNRHS